jgi:hypothetical protein
MNKKSKLRTGHSSRCSGSVFGMVLSDGFLVTNSRFEWTPLQRHFIAVAVIGEKPREPALFLGRQPFNSKHPEQAERDRELQLLGGRMLIRYNELLTRSDEGEGQSGGQRRIDS